MEVDAVDLELVLHPADAGTEDEAIVAQKRQRAGRARDLEDVAQRQHVDRHRKADALRYGADGSDGRPAVRVPGVRRHRVFTVLGIGVGRAHIARKDAMISEHHALTGEYYGEAG